MEVYREEWMGDFLVLEYKPIELQKPSYAIISLPDTGLVGVISAWHITKVLQLSEVGGLDSYTYLPPIVVVSNKLLRTPIRVFSGGNILIIYSEFIPVQQGLLQLSKILVNYMERKGVDYVLLPSGMPIQNRFEVENLKTYYIATTPKALELLKNIDIEPFENGFLAGPYALLLKEFTRARLNAILLLTESFLEFPDPEASAKNIDVISRIIGRHIDVKELLEQAELIRLRARDAMKNTLRGLAQMRKDVEYAVPLYT
jgi:Archaeal enzymes of ATP-grasp superfamily|uniref:Proteasome assembly chaperone family protein n=1 Tax=Ignisphaera aggregans TaxID=334771 RepID=A0A7J3Z585_9CREN